MAEQNASVYKPLTTRAACAMVFLSAYTFQCLSGIFEGAFALWGVSVRANNLEVPDGALALYDFVTASTLLVMVPTYLGCVISFLAWFYRAHRNLKALQNEDLEYKSGWTIGGFMVPFLNLVRPLQMMRETWHGSDPALLGQSPVFVQQGVRRGTPALVGWWWCLFLLMGILGRTSERLGERIQKSPNPTDGDFQVYAWFVIVGALFAIAAGIVAVRLIWTLTKRQRQRRELLLESAADH